MLLSPLVLISSWLIQVSVLFICLEACFLAAWAGLFQASLLMLLLLLLGAQVPIPKDRKLKGWNILKILKVWPRQIDKVHREIFRKDGKIE